jgi:hypothetical protein
MTTRTDVGWHAAARFSTKNGENLRGEPATRDRKADNFGIPGA